MPGLELKFWQKQEATASLLTTGGPTMETAASAASTELNGIALLEEEPRLAGPASPVSFSWGRQLTGTTQSISTEETRCLIGIAIVLLLPPSSGLVPNSFEWKNKTKKQSLHNQMKV